MTMMKTIAMMQMMRRIETYTDTQINLLLSSLIWGTKDLKLQITSLKAWETEESNSSSSLAISNTTKMRDPRFHSQAVIEVKSSKDKNNHRSCFNNRSSISFSHTLERKRDSSIRVLNLQPIKINRHLIRKSFLMGSLLTILQILCLVRNNLRMEWCRRGATVCLAQETDRSLPTKWGVSLVLTTSLRTNISNLWLLHKWYKADRARKIWKRGRSQNHLRMKEDLVLPKNLWGHLAGHSQVSSITIWGIRKITPLQTKMSWLTTLKTSLLGLLSEVRLFL